MKKIYLTLFLVVACIMSCSKSPEDKAKTSVKIFMKENLKKADSYEPISFSKLDTLDKADTSETKLISIYKIAHSYSIKNSENEKVKMAVSFLLNNELKVNRTVTKSINGDYGTLTGNVYWKYNNYVGNKPDAGTTITLYSLDTVRVNLKLETNADVQGDYTIEKILPGKYLLKVNSENTTDCPERHVKNLVSISSEIHQLFNFDLNDYNKQIDEIMNLDSSYVSVLLDSDRKKYGGLLSQVEKYTAIEKEMREKANTLIMSVSIRRTTG